MDPVTTTSLGTGAISSIRNAVDLGKNVGSHELKAAISDAYDDILSVKARILELDEENHSLKTKLAMREEIEGPILPHGYFRGRLDAISI